MEARIESNGAGAMVEACVRQGAKVGYLDIDVAGAAALQDKLEGKPLFVRADLADIDATRAAIARIGEANGAVRVLVNNAANDERHATAEVTPDYWDRSMAVNLRHQFFCAQAVHGAMCRRRVDHQFQLDRLDGQRAWAGRLCRRQGRGDRPDPHARQGVRARITSGSTLSPPVR